MSGRFCFVRTSDLFFLQSFIILSSSLGGSSIVASKPTPSIVPLIIFSYIKSLELSPNIGYTHMIINLNVKPSTVLGFV